jgi:Cu-Zn family superoxide dismutase
MFAVCVLTFNVFGTLYFAQHHPNSPTIISGRIHGLSPGPHGFHVHENGDTGNDCNNAGAHYNPFGMNHSAPFSRSRHVGDLGNIMSFHSSGTGTVAAVKIVDFGTQLFGDRSIIGKTLVIHEKADDLGLGADEESLRTGNAGGRVACCVIREDTPRWSTNINVTQGTNGASYTNLNLLLLVLSSVYSRFSTART